MGTDFKIKKMTWDGGEVPMKDMNNHDVKREFLMQWESYKNDKSIREILDAKYENIKDCQWDCAIVQIFSKKKCLN